MTFEIKTGDWTTLKADAAGIRYTVFVQEQQVPISIEMDDLDVECQHAVLYVDKKPIATGRLLPNAHIGRMAVLPAYRGSGAGAQVLRALIEIARDRGETAVFLSAQTHALGFYTRYGFSAYGEVYKDADIDHQMMQLHL